MGKQIVPYEIDGVEDLSPLEIIEFAIREFNPKYTIGLFSGGHDSLVATHIASRHPRFSFVGHINTGIGIEETRDFVRKTCNEWGIDLKEYRAVDYLGRGDKPKPQVYADIVKEHGFPGPGSHTHMYRRLKDRPLRHMIRDLDRKSTDKTLLVTGVRAQESIRRMGNVTPIQVWEGTKIWVAPIWSFTKTDVTRYISQYELRRNPVVDKIHMSGECLCGAYAHKGELDEIGLWFPEVKKYIQQLEQAVHACGHHWNWEESPSDAREPLEKKGAESYLCAGCGKH